MDKFTEKLREFFSQGNKALEEIEEMADAQKNNMDRDRIHSPPSRILKDASEAIIDTAQGSIEKATPRLEGIDVDKTLPARAIKDVAEQMINSLGNPFERLGSWAQDDEKSSDDSGEGSKEDSSEESKEEVKAPDYDIDEMAGEFILGAWGNGQDRIDNMINAGYTIDDYNKIQQRVNEAYESGRDLHEWTDKANAKLHYW